MDRFGRVILFAGFGCFVLAFALSGLYPYMISDGLAPEASIADVAQNVSPDFVALKELDPPAFSAAFPAATAALTSRELSGLAPDDPRRATSDATWRTLYAQALQQGRDAYIADGCWHCHSQYVRPVANEAERFGPVLPSANDNNALQRPVMWGTRRVGPDLTHEGGLRSNDWHVAHFMDPQSTSPGSVMPRYPWFYRHGFQVRRRIDPEAADRGRLDPQTSYPIAGIHATQAEAQAALERHVAELPPALAGEKDRLFIAEGDGLNARGLSLLAYVQWLGTWSPPAVAKAGAP